jgi:putative peptide maturation dehydrogenase
LAVTEVRRSRYAFFYLEDDYPLELTAILTGQMPSSGSDGRMVALPALTGTPHRIGAEALEMLRSIPGERWLEATDLDPTILRELCDHGLVISSSDEPRLAYFREREERLSADEWNPYAALYHFMTQWSGFDIRDGTENFELTPEIAAAGREFLAEHGHPPPAFAEPRGSRRLKLPAIERDGELYAKLTARKTTRAFDRETPMSLEEFDTVLRYVFGCHGYAVTFSEVVTIKRTSPSGGGLHPIEVYPIVTNVAGVEPGIYHYSPRDHSLGLLSPLPADEGARLATSFMCGQSYFGDAHASFVLTARFYRNHWKYRRQQRAYVGILMDAAHLSQTLYLVSEDLGLGAFITIAINGRDIESCLGLDGVDEGVIAMVGCGPKGAPGSPLELRFTEAPIGEELWSRSQGQV